MGSFQKFTATSGYQIRKIHKRCNLLQTLTTLITLLLCHYKQWFAPIKTLNKIITSKGNAPQSLFLSFY